MNERIGCSGLTVGDNETLSKFKDRYSIVIEQTNVYIFDLNLIDHEIYVSDNFLEHTGTENRKQAILKQMISSKDVHPDDLDKFKSYVSISSSGMVTDSITYRRKNPDGSYTWIRSNKKNIFNEYGKLIRVLGTAQDVSAEMELYERIKNRDDRDILTDIPNLSAFTIKAQATIRENRDKNYAIVVFDIDKFRIINDLYGSKEGDGVLRYIGYILKTKISESGLCCRMYADNFAILTEYESDSDFSKITDLLREAIKQYPVNLGIMLSFGVCKADGESDIITLCDHAGLAKKTIKGNVLKLVAFYDEALRKQGIEDKDIENEMNLALENGEFEMYLQPKVSIATTEVIGAEALVRWVHPIKGVISPGQFIPLFEKNGFIVKLDYYIWEKAFATLRKWMDEGFTPIPISVNVSRLHLHNAGIVGHFIRLADKYKIPRNFIELELTETIFLSNLNEVTQLVCSLKAEGFVLAMDDFGSGYSSLNMLKDVPIDSIKIDRGFFSEIVETDRGNTVIQYTIAMARKLNIDVIAEGVENFVQAEFLYRAGCETAQGLFYSEPLPVKKFEQYTFGYYNK
jgi:diguanylate cyclase (GGDEF)-like protein/PAS domain S-box-containing protein